jgi:dihydropteroate synthase
MGVLNVTPDSFSDGGKYLDVENAVRRGVEMAAEGADIIDVGGESTRPRGGAYGEGAASISMQEELDRVMPVIERLRRETDVPLSIDTTKSSIARTALAAGACLVNDISGLRFDPGMAGTIALAGGSVVIMHIRGSPQTMQQHTEYVDLFGEVLGYLREGADIAQRAGIRQIMVDPGIGFGKTTADNYRLVAGIPYFTSLGYPVLVGPSRKAFVGEVTGLPVNDRLEGTLAAVVGAILAGAHVVRVHDVREVRRAALVADSLRRAASTIPPRISSPAQ